MRLSAHRLAVDLRGVFSVVALTVTIMMALHVGTSRAAAFTWSQVTDVPATAPANAASEPEARFDWGDCPTVGSCVAVGSYTDEDGNQDAMAASRTNGSWGQAVEIALPAGAATTAQNAGFAFPEPTVACAEPGACVAVGFFVKEGGGEEAMAIGETDGVWGAASEIALPANAASNPGARFRSIACPAPGSCVAAGDYRDKNGSREGMIAVQTGGVWGQSSEVELPVNAASNPEVDLHSLACSAAGSCVASGEYLDGSTTALEAMVVTETAGKWGRAGQVTLPANAASTPRSAIHSVVCVASGPCTAVGRYTDSSGSRQAMAVEETDGLWGEAREIAPPANAAGNPEVDFGLAPISIACAGSGSCFIIARYVDGSGDHNAMVAREGGGLWGQASEIAPPANAASNPEAILYPACATASSCVAAGAYTDENGHREALVAEETGESWSNGREVAAPASAAINPKIIFGEVECPEVGSCVAFGEYEDGGGSTRDMEVTGMTAPEDVTAPTVSGTGKVGQALVCSQGSWTASPTEYAYKWLRDGVAIGMMGSSMYTATSADEGHSLSCEVTATNAVGSKGAVSADSVTVAKEIKENKEPEKKDEEPSKDVSTGSVTLLGRLISVRRGKASVELACTGTATCVGRLTLTVERKARKGKTRARMIGSAALSILSGKKEIITIALTAYGRRLLKAAHGKLRATLVIVKSSPSPTSTERKRVRLVHRSAPPRRRKR